MNGEDLPRRGEVWWVRIDKRRPAVIVQTEVREPRVRTFLAVPLTSRLHLEHLPGNLRLERKATGLPKASVANVYDLQKVFAVDLIKPVAMLPHRDIARLDEGLRLVLDL